MKYVTLYPETSNIELVKDVGQIPYNLQKFYGIDTEIVSNSIDTNGINIEYVKGVKLTRLTTSSVKGKFIYLAEIKYLFSHAKEIDWLNIYHCGRRSLILAKIYKFLNPSGKVHLKMDLDFRGCNLYDENLNERDIFQKNMKVMDLVTVESESVRDRIQKYTDKTILVLPNGFYPLPAKNVKKQNLFLTVGRLGTKQKATDILLQAFADSSSTYDWQLVLIGSLDSNFKDYLKTFNEEHPDLKDRITFKAPIHDREKLYYEYAKAKVFILDSRWESFGLVLPEALSQGCTIITSNQVPIAEEITNNEKFGRIVRADDVDELSSVMKEVTTQKFDDNSINEKINYAKEKYSWKQICKNLNIYLRGQQ